MRNDILIFTDDKTDNSCHENLNKDMQNINKWLMMNKLKLNEKKRNFQRLIWTII